jgi:hypothetical protein
MLDIKKPYFDIFKSLLAERESTFIYNFATPEVKNLMQ